MPIQWQGPKGVYETGIVAMGSQAGRTVVTVSPHLFRPVEVTARLPTAFMRAVFLAAVLVGVPVSFHGPAIQLQP